MAIYFSSVNSDVRMWLCIVSIYFLELIQIWWHGGAGIAERSEQGTLSPMATHNLCVPSMGTVLKGFKSPV